MTFFAGKKILITGGTGHLGSALAHVLVRGLELAPVDIRIFYLAGTPAESLRDLPGLDLFPGEILREEGGRYIITGRPEDNLSFKDLFGIMADVLRRQFPGKKIRTPKRVVPSWLAMAGAYVSESLARLSGRPALLNRAVVRAGSAPLYYSYENAARDLGYFPKRTFLQGVEDMVEYYRAENFFEARGRHGDR